MDTRTGKFVCDESGKPIELPGKVLRMEVEGDVLMLETEAGNFILTAEHRFLHCAPGGTA